ncbi:hypothetical protein BD769DRAFT_1680580 [Suillus cothurnatus]|nr:hypothetical protein BD769DRAFT_1680580 [Suillus cothurnatus]
MQKGITDIRHSTFTRAKVLHMAMISSKGADKLMNKTSKLVAAHSSPNATYMQAEYQLVSMNTQHFIALVTLISTPTYFYLAMLTHPSSTSTVTPP